LAFRRGTEVTIDVFISYAREERDRCVEFAKKLKALDLRVWFDAEIRPGKSFEDEIERALASASAVLVLWSKRSVASRWVRNESRRADERGKLVAACLEQCEIPLAVSHVHHVSLAGTIEDDDESWQMVLDAIDSLLTEARQLASRSRAKALEARRASKDSGEPVAEPSAGIVNLPRFSSISHDEWGEVILDAEQEITVCGISLWRLFDPSSTPFRYPDDGVYRRVNLSTMLPALALAGRRVRVMMMDERNPALPALLIEPDGRPADETKVEDMRREIRRSRIAVNICRKAVTEFGGKMDVANAGSIELLPIAHGIPPGQVTWTEKTMIITPFLACYAGTLGPTFIVPSSEQWHKAIRAELRTLAFKD
jgi:hypothetical protein